jgi:hypothetical protein
MELVTTPSRSHQRDIMEMQRVGRTGTNGPRIGTMHGETHRKPGDGKGTDRKQGPIHRQAPEATNQMRISTKDANRRVKGREKTNREKE